MSLRFRINLLISLLSLAFLLALGFVVTDNLRSSVREEVAAATRVSVQMLRAFVMEAERAEGADQEGRLEAYVQSLGRVRSNEIVVYRGSELVYASPPSPYKAGRSAPEWFAALVGPVSKVTEIRARNLRIYITPDASRAILDAWDGLHAFFWLLLGFFAALNALVYWFVGRSLRPVREVVEALSHMEEGRFHARLPRYPLPELASISEGFNRMAERLERSLSQNRLLTREQELASVIRQHLEAERKTIARELHDELGQCLTAIRSIALSISHRSRDSAPEIHGSAQTIASVAGESYDGVHRIIHRLRPPALENAGLGDAMRELVENWRDSHPGVEVALDLEAGIEEAGEATMLAVFRVVQECLTNVAKHSGATRVEIRARRTGAADAAAPRLELEVQDNGAGMEPRAAAAEVGHYGLVGMRERVEALNGTLEIESGPGRGLRVRAVLPLGDGEGGQELPWLLA
ncbi:MAG TPA: ATP-binding protein [Burkholderiales bacterium]